MNRLAAVFAFKIAGTLALWCAPLLLFPGWLLDAAGLPRHPTDAFLRLLGWAYLALCVGYAFGLRDALHGRRAAGPIWMGIVSNGGACVLLAYFGLSGTWAGWGAVPQVLGWGSAVATFAITAGLYAYGVRGEARTAGRPLESGGPAR